ncbi:TetR/AcrR family transcriptional regulator [Paeniglutamicibacter cryotolerans]|uniref:AcrR family transcriptional regulator n=1 Tax=Paeniglutamicibacter cryotolerans TaxID=670079 RepID=A0A839QGJ7_9MICC|nr:TetR family transcriptional regulator [Paeniglutamicibacter cryotolerans]MBB2995289.1 AcrR family transcriptional regulator [Paeniglutamicibacter cryotolerans]
MSTASTDLTGRARLRDAAIECFAARGFGESLRAIAARAGVTAGLVRHHFGSKDVLRAECDATVLERYRMLKTQSMDTDPALLFSTFPSSREGGILMLYILRSVRDGGTAGREFLANLVTEALVFTRDAVARGIVVPSRNEEARVRFLVQQAVGGLIVKLAMYPDTDLDDFSGVMECFSAETMLPTLELYTEGLFADSGYLDQFLAYAAATPNPPAGPAGEPAHR